MLNNIDASLRAMCQAQEKKIKAQQRMLGQLQLGCASLGTLAAQYKTALDEMIKIADEYIALVPDSVFEKYIENAKKVSSSNGRGPADAILEISLQNQKFREVIAAYQTGQDKLEAEIVILKEKLAQYEKLKEA